MSKYNHIVNANNKVNPPDDKAIGSELYHNRRVTKTYKEWSKLYKNVEYQVAIGVLEKVEE